MKQNILTHHSSLKKAATLGIAVIAIASTPNQTYASWKVWLVETITSWALGKALVGCGHNGDVKRQWRSNAD